MTTEQRKTAKVVVLGDIGRSPRMQYHALSLANNGLNVIIIGFQDSTPMNEILSHPQISIKKISSIGFHEGPRLVNYAIKVLWQTICLLFTLFITGSCQVLLCQNPPAIPTLPVCRFYCLVTRTKFIIDWHNYAYSIMALSLTADHLLVKVARVVEKMFGRSSDHNFCVTYTMKEDLLTNWHLKNATVLYDRPPKIFHPLTLEEKHNWFLKIGTMYSAFRPEEPSENTELHTAFTRVVDNNIELKADRPGLLFSSTSWTPDEDFGIMIDALQVYETTYETAKNLPELICVVTGKGPMKNTYLKIIEERHWKHIKVITPWLEAMDYPKMVASADLGLSLHTSSSGLDLPMKVVDMFGAGLPVCAFDFLSLDELVLDGVNGYTFRNTHELARVLVTWFKDFPRNDKQNNIIEKMKTELLQFQQTRWEDNWNLRVKQFFV